MGRAVLLTRLALILHESGQDILEQHSLAVGWVALKIKSFFSLK